MLSKKQPLTPASSQYEMPILELMLEVAYVQLKNERAKEG